ncbi:putative biogenesis of lysosome-related organelles complex 1 subunit 1 [Paratrimastix pyriformis]|uniref:Biogenesis of lysosome-related organelles complex 1 subunit 1 n=1 Tax=Paratrimastix pyriformis TaxID=342808 RepID=A0ABQ8UHB4_9EUKA|nr:putative biogenesis of lysosome-related organelles complex 1 subunit 1 [Paratrimastix pyriformis]
MSLTRLVQQHFAQQEALRAEIERLKKACLKNSTQVADEMMRSLNEGVSAVFQNQQRLESEAKKIQQNSARFVKQANQWVQVGSQMEASLKELGDVQTWIRSIVGDMRVVADCLSSIAETSAT